MSLINIVFDGFSKLLGILTSQTKPPINKRLVKRKPKSNPSVNAKAQFEFADASIKLVSFYSSSAKLEQKLNEDNLVRLNSVKLALQKFVEICNKFPSKVSNYQSFLNEINSYINELDSTIKVIGNSPAGLKNILIRSLKITFRDNIKDKCKFLISALKVKPLNTSSAMYSP